MTYFLDDGSISNSYNYQDAPISNIRYDGDRFKVNANMNTTSTVAFIGGCVVGAALAYLIFKNINSNSK